MLVRSGNDRFGFFRSTLQVDHEYGGTMAAVVTVHEEFSLGHFSSCDGATTSPPRQPQKTRARRFKGAKQLRIRLSIHLILTRNRWWKFG